MLDCLSQVMLFSAQNMTHNYLVWLVSGKHPYNLSQLFSAFLLFFLLTSYYHVLRISLPYFVLIIFIFSPFHQIIGSTRKIVFMIYRYDLSSISLGWILGWGVVCFYAWYYKWTLSPTRRRKLVVWVRGAKKKVIFFFLFSTMCTPLAIFTLFSEGL